VQDRHPIGAGQDDLVKVYCASIQQIGTYWEIDNPFAVDNDIV